MTIFLLLHLLFPVIYKINTYNSIRILKIGTLLYLYDVLHFALYFEEQTNKINVKRSCFNGMSFMDFKNHAKSIVYIRLQCFRFTRICFFHDNFIL